MKVFDGNIQITANNSFMGLLAVWNERHLKKVLHGYFDYYNNDRTHLGIKKESPTGRQVTKQTSIYDRLVDLPKVGGLHHRYEWLKAA
jgi:hypothetical protein